MSFDLIPALDILDGKVVRLRQGREGEAIFYPRKPLEMLAEFKSAGARRVHLVDLTGALRGSRQASLLELIRSSPLPVELGGGIRDEAAATTALEAGAERVILGTVFLENPVLGKALVARFGSEKILGALDLKDGFAVGRGWAESGKLKAADAARVMFDAGIRLAVMTPVSRDGTLEGPSIPEIRALAEASGLDYVYAGGISSREDVLRVRDQGGPRCRGVISGRALYDGRLDLAPAIRTLAAGR